LIPIFGLSLLLAGHSLDISSIVTIHAMKDVDSIYNVGWSLLVGALTFPPPPHPRRPPRRQTSHSSLFDNGAHRMAPTYWYQKPEAATAAIQAPTQHPKQA